MEDRLLATNGIEMETGYFLDLLYIIVDLPKGQVWFVWKLIV